MKIDRYLTLFGLSILVGSSILPTQVSASTYQTEGGRTTIVLDERPNLLSRPQNSFYFTESGGRQWMGQINITTVSAGAGQTFYNGTFQDRAIGSGTPMACTGNIRIARQNPRSSSRVTAQVVWQVTGGSGCPSVGQTFTLSLQESLPRADRNGDFNATNSNTWMSETNGLVTWQAWRVISSDGLNCRVSPNGTIQRSYAANAQIQPDTRGGNAFVMENGSPWMLTRDRCYVRASNSFIQPVSVPF